MESKKGKERAQARKSIIDEKRFAEMAEENPDAPVLFVGDHPYIIDDRFARSDDDCFEDYRAFLKFRLEVLGSLDALMEELDFYDNADFIDWAFYVTQPEDWEAIVNDVYDMEELGEYVA